MSEKVHQVQQDLDNIKYAKVSRVELFRSFLNKNPIDSSQQQHHVTQSYSRKVSHFLVKKKSSLDKGSNRYKLSKSNFVCLQRGRETPRQI